MINPIDRATKKISSGNNESYRDIPDMMHDILYGHPSVRLPISPNKKQVIERIKQHLTQEPSFTMVP